MASTHAPPSLDAGLTQLADELRAAAGDNLVGVALYGGLAKGRFTPGISDVNVLVVVAKAGWSELVRLAPALSGARRSHDVIAFVATPADLARVAELFPVKALDMKAAHRVLAGNPGLDAIHVAPDGVLDRAHQQVLNHALRLRQRVVERAAEPSIVWQGVLRGLPKLAVTLESVLRIGGDAVPADRGGVLRAAAAKLGVPAADMEPFAAVHRTDPPPADDVAQQRIDAWLRLLDLLGGRIAALRVQR